MRTPGPHCFLYSVIFVTMISGGILNAQNKKDYDFKNFSSIDISGAITAEISQGSEFKVSAEGEEKILHLLDLHLDEDELMAGVKNSKNISKGSVLLRIQLPALKDLDISGASEVKLNSVEQSNIEIELSGASSLKGNLMAGGSKINASGASKVEIEGHSSIMTLELEGASSFASPSFEVRGDLFFESSGASSAKIKSLGRMSLQLSGASSLVYSGDAKIIRQIVEGASTVKKAD